MGLLTGTISGKITGPISGLITDGVHGIISAAVYILRLYLNLTALGGEDATQNTGSSKWIRAWDATVGLLMTEVPAGNPAVEGMRGIVNKYMYSDDFSNVAWEKQAGITVIGLALGVGPNGEDAWEIDLASVNGLRQIPGNAIGDIHQVSFWVAAKTGTVDVKLYDGKTFTSAISLDTTFKRMAHSSLAGMLGADRSTGLYGAATNQGRIYLINAQLENVLGHGNLNPGEYVATAATSVAEFFNTTNANTVAANVVTEATGGKLTPTNDDGIHQLYDYWTAKTFVAGDNVYVVGTDNHNYALTCTIGGASVAIPVVDKTDIGSTVSDGVATWSVDSYYTNIATDTENHSTHVLSEVEGRNLLTYSQEYNDVAWQKSASVVSPDSTTAPDGTSTADIITDNVAGGSGVVAVLRTVTVGNSTTYTYSVYAKQKQLTWIHLAALNFTTPGSGGVYFDLANGVLGNESAGIVGRIEEAGHGFYRCSIVFTTDIADTSGNIQTYLANGDGDVIVDRDGTSDVYLWQADFVVSDYPQSMILTTAAAVTRTADAFASNQLLTADKLRMRLTPEHTGAQTFLSDVTNIISYTGTQLEVTDGVTTLTHVVTPVDGDIVGIDRTTGKLYYNGSLVDTDAVYDPTWAALTAINNVTDIEDNSSLDLTDTAWKD